MMYKVLVSTILSSFSTHVAVLAQSHQGDQTRAVVALPSPQEIEAAMRQQFRDSGFRPTRAASLDQSLEDLLNAGYGIVATGQGSPGSSTFTLRDAAGRKWAFCTLSRAPGDAPGTSNSQCTALN